MHCISLRLPCATSTSQLWLLNRWRGGVSSHLLLLLFAQAPVCMQDVDLLLVCVGLVTSNQSQPSLFLSANNSLLHIIVEVDVHVSTWAHWWPNTIPTIVHTLCSAECVAICMYPRCYVSGIVKHFHSFHSSVSIFSCVCRVFFAWALAPSM